MLSAIRFSQVSAYQSEMVSLKLKINEKKKKKKKKNHSLLSWKRFRVLYFCHIWEQVGNNYIFPLVSETYIKPSHHHELLFIYSFFFPKSKGLGSILQNAFINLCPHKYAHHLSEFICGPTLAVSYPNDIWALKIKIVFFNSKAGPKTYLKSFMRFCPPFR